MKSVQAKGYSKEKALATTDLDVNLEMLKNATRKWKEAGSPVGGKELTAFMVEYMAANKKNIGAYIVVEPSSDDTRTRPYSVINEPTRGRRKKKTVYQIKEGTFDVKESKNEDGDPVKKVTVKSLGPVVHKAEKKDEAISSMKELIEANHTDYVIEIVSEVVEGQPYAAYGKYTPSKSAKEGTFVFFLAD